MASLTIRNITINPLELITVERLEGPPKVGWFTKISRAVIGLFSYSSPASQTPEDGQEEPHVRQDAVDILVAPFETKATDIPAADPTRGEGALRLTFRTPGTPATAHTYTVAVPGPSTTRSQVMQASPAADAPLALTAIYTPSSAQLAIFSSATLPAWMQHLRDEYPLSMLSIPGTHNSPTCHVALPSVRCQAVGVRAQLDNGVRFLDVRVSASRDSDVLTLVHSVFPIALTGARYFADLLRDVYAFLDANPSETVLMSVKREGTGKATDQQLSLYLHRRYCGGGSGDVVDDHDDDGSDDNDKDHNNDVRRRWFTQPHIPTLGETRGRIVLIRRFHLDDTLRGEHGGRGWGLDAAAWPDNCADAPTGSGLLRVQDFYEVDQSTNIEKKIDLARAQLERACQQQFADIAPAVGEPKPEVPPPPLPFFINFLSASNFFNASCWPERIAAKVNPSISEYLCVRHAEKGKGPAQLDIGDAGTGIVVTDWVGQDGDWDLIRCIVGWNARLQLRK